jgi:hypothetical protein
MLSNHHRLFRSFLLGYLWLLGMPAAQPASNEAFRISSADGELRALLPLDWEQVDLHAAGAQLQAANSAKHMYLVVSSTRRADTAGTLEDYASGDLQTTTRRSLDATISEPRQFRIDAGECIQYQIHASLPKSQIRVAYLLTFMQTQHHYLKIAGWTTESRFQTSVAELSRVTDNVEEARVVSK